MLVIGLGHKARQGKDTLASFLKEYYGSIYNIQLYSFAKVLKDEVNTLYEEFGDWGKTFEYIHHEIQELPDWVVIEHNPDMSDPLCPYGKQRTLLQWWGTEYRRAQSPNYWVKRLAETINHDNPQIALITDVRFPNEYHWVKSLGRSGLVVKVSRKNSTSYVNQHVSETMLDSYDFDYYIEASDLDELRDDAKIFFGMIENRDRLPEGFEEEPMF